MFMTPFGVKPCSYRDQARRARRRASTRQIKLMLKIVSIHTDRVGSRWSASSNLHTSNERCQFNFKLYI